MNVLQVMVLAHHYQTETGKWWNDYGFIRFSSIVDELSWPDLFWAWHFGSILASAIVFDMPWY